MRCNVIKQPIYLADEIIFNIADKKPVIVYLTGITNNDTYSSITDLIGLLTTADTGIKLDENNTISDDKYTTFSYQTSSDWQRKDITIGNIKYSLYENTLVFGVSKSKLRLSFVVKDYTSDSQTFYEDLVGKVLTASSDIKNLSWLLSTGYSITGRILKGIRIENKLEAINHTIDCSPSMQVMSSNSATPKYMYVASDYSQTTIDLNTVKSITIRNKLGDINLVYTTKNNNSYTLMFY